MMKKAGNGYTGKILQVDLTKAKLKDSPTPKDWAKQYIGGSGLAARMLYPALSRTLDPLSADNPLLLMAGPLTGTSVPMCGRLSICSKSPLTQLWGECNIGGNFGARLRQSGYDGILITGRAEQPTMLTVLNGQTSFKDGGEMWTLRVTETQKQLQQDYNDPRMASLTIGPAGENLVKFASIMTEGGRAAGRMGLGAVMGSKNLKAIITIGEKPIPIAKPDALSELVKTATKIMMEDFQIETYKEMGTAAFFGASYELGSLPVKYWSSSEFPTYDNISGSTMFEKILVGNAGCYRCPVRCGRVIEIPEGKYKLSPTSGPEYETLASLGSMFLNDNLEALTFAAHLCDDLGLDTISCGTTIAFACYLMENNKLTSKEAGMKIDWGDSAVQIELIKQIAAREGFGDILAEGTRALGERYDAADSAVHSKGLENACWGVRAQFGNAAMYATSPRGGSHLDADIYWVLNGQVIPELGIDADDSYTDEGMGKLVALTQNWRMITNSLIMCIFATYKPGEVAQMYSLITGVDTSTKELMQIGERIITLKRLINLKMGFKAKDDTISPHLLRPLEGPTEGRVPNLEKQLNEYYAFRDWDRKSGRPSVAALNKVGLTDLQE